MICLCEKCFPPRTPAGHEVEVLSHVPMSPCAVCGAHDERRGGDAVCYLFVNDPREGAK